MPFAHITMTADGDRSLNGTDLITTTYPIGLKQTEMDAFKRHARDLKAPTAKAQIVLEVDSKEQSLDRAVLLLREVGISDVDAHPISDAPGLFAILTIPEDDLQAAAVKLSEAGFSRLKGIKSGGFPREGND